MKIQVSVDTFLHLAQLGGYDTTLRGDVPIKVYLSTRIHAVDDFRKIENNLFAEQPQEARVLAQRLRQGVPRQPPEGEQIIRIHLRLGVSREKTNTLQKELETYPRLYKVLGIRPPTPPEPEEPEEKPVKKERKKKRTERVETVVHGSDDEIVTELFDSDEFRIRQREQARLAQA